MDCSSQNLQKIRKRNSSESRKAVCTKSVDLLVEINPELHSQAEAVHGVIPLEFYKEFQKFG